MSVSIRRIILSIGLTFLSLGSAYAQWSGGVKADGAWNFRQSNNENADFKLKYDRNKFHIGTDIYFGHSYLPSTQSTDILDGKKEQNEYYKNENKEINPRKFKAGATLDLGYVFNSCNTLDATLSYGYNGRSENSLLETMRYSNPDKARLHGTQMDSTYFASSKFTATIAYRHNFKSRPDALLEINFWSSTKLDADANRRITDGDFYSKHKNYATYSSINDFDSKLSASYNDVFRFAGSDLKLKAGLDFLSDEDLDGYAAETYVNGVWRDSTAYRQSYYYDSESLEPYANLTYSLGKFDFFVKERMQLFWHSMLDKLEDRKKSKDITGLFDKYDIRNLLNAGITYRINEKHRLVLEYSRSISRPDYKKLCPTLMIGKSEGEYFLGNPDLLPEITDKINLGFTYTKGIFITKFDINYRDKRNTAEKVIDLERSKDVTDPGVKTIFTWINNKRQDSFGSKLNFKMNGTEVKAEIWAAFNYDKYWKDSKVDKEDFNYELGTSVDVFLNESTKLYSSLAYISAKQSAYNLKGEDVVASLRFSKILAKGLELYFELQDIVDKEVYEETWNADMNYLKIVSTKPMQGMALLGVNFVF